MKHLTWLWPALCVYLIYVSLQPPKHDTHGTSGHMGAGMFACLCAFILLVIGLVTSVLVEIFA